MRKPLHSYQPAPGFSLVEFVVVIILAGIVGVVVVPRFVAPNSFDDIAAQDGLISTIRAAQQASLGRASVTFEIANGGDEWEFVAKAGSTELHRFEVSDRQLMLETGSAAASADTCATPAGDFDSPINDLQLAFSERGDLASYTYNSLMEPVDAAFNGVRICINNTDALSVCVSPAGYAYAGKCDD